jgi:hypothetical protein
MLRVVLLNYNMFFMNRYQMHVACLFALWFKHVCDDSKCIFGTKGWSSWFCKHAACISWTGR